MDPGKDWNVEKPQSWNLYAYTRNSPINNIDTDGEGVRNAVGKILEIAVDKITLNVLKRGATKAELKAAAAAGEDVLGSRKMMKDIAKELGDGKPPMHHPAKDGQGGHYHVAGHPSGYGHFFYGLLTFIPYVGWIFDVDDLDEGDANPVINDRAIQMFGTNFYGLSAPQRNAVMQSLRRATDADNAKSNEKKKKITNVDKKCDGCL